MWLNILEVIFRIIVVLVIGFVTIVYIVCKYNYIEPTKQELKKIEKSKNKKVKEGK